MLTASYLLILLLHVSRLQSSLHQRTQATVPIFPYSAATPPSPEPSNPHPHQKSAGSNPLGVFQACCTYPNANDRIYWFQCLSPHWNRNSLKAELGLTQSWGFSSLDA